MDYVFLQEYDSFSDEELHGTQRSHQYIHDKVDKTTNSREKEKKHGRCEK